MNTRRFFTKASIAIALVGLLTSGAIWELRRVRAFNPQPDPPGFGMIGLTRGQTMRLNIVNLNPPPDPDRQLPPPCRVVLSFRDANGRPFTNSDGHVIRRVVELQGGQSDFLDLNADMLGNPSTNADLPPNSRFQLRPFVRVQLEPSGNQVPPDPCRASMEVFDNTTGHTSIFTAGFSAPPEPDRQ